MIFLIFFAGLVSTVLSVNTSIPCYRNSSYVVNPRYRMYYHVSAECGWINDPNGFSIYQGQYQLFYQYNPYSSSTNGATEWGHVRSPNMIDWERLPVALYTDEPYDKHVCFTGNAVVDDCGQHVLIYTGNVVNEGEFQNLAYSSNSIDYEKYKDNPVIVGKEFQPKFRDPYVWRNEDIWYMVVGHETFNNRGQVLLFKSSNLKQWTFLNVLSESNGTLGYMWECPNFFQIGDKFVLLFGPQGIAPQGDKYRNLYQVLYSVGNFSYETHKFVPDRESEAIELDAGHDFYAPQTILTEDGVRMLVAWMSMWERHYPEESDGWAGAITLPREITLDKNNRLLMTPIDETLTLRSAIYYRNIACCFNSIELQVNRAEVIYELQLTGNETEVGLYLDFGGNVSIRISYSLSDRRVSLDRGGDDGLRCREWNAGAVLKWRLFIDASSIELFCGSGEVVFSSRVFPQAPAVISPICSSSCGNVTIYSLRQSIF